MVQKIVIQMYLNDEKHRRKAMQIASVANGVTSIAIKGEGKDQIEVIGDGVDSVKLTSSLRKKVSRSNANLILLEQVKAAKEEGGNEENYQAPIQWQYSSYPPFYMMDPNPPNCSIMW